MSNDDHSQPASVGPYRIVRQLGQGGMGVVYEAVNEGIGRRVAIKVLRSEYAHNSAVAQRFFNEARAANLIEHPALVQISEFGVLPDGATYLVMELLKGENLASRLRSVGALPLPGVLRIGCQLAEVLCAAHHKNIIHRDISIIYSVSLRKPQKTIQRRRRDDVDTSSEWKSHILDAASH